MYQKITGPQGLLHVRWILFCWCNSMLGQIVTSAIGVGQLLDWVGFRFAPKLHGILTKAQAVLQLFSFAILICWLINTLSV